MARWHGFKRFNLFKAKSIEEGLSHELVKLILLAVEQSGDGIAVSDLDGNLRYMNRAFAEMHGYTPDELVGKHLSVFHNDEQLAAVEAAVR